MVTEINYIDFGDGNAVLYPSFATERYTNESESFIYPGSAFTIEFYKVIKSNKVTICFIPQDVSEQAYLSCTIIQNKDWHRFGDHDSKISLGFKILPPIEI